MTHITRTLSPLMPHPDTLAIYAARRNGRLFHLMWHHAWRVEKQKQALNLWTAVCLFRHQTSKEVKVFVAVTAWDKNLL